MNCPKLQPPSYKIISSAAMTNSGDSLTVINLAKTSTIKSISKGEIVATGEIDSTYIEFNSLEDYESGISEIYVIISGINHKGNVSLTLSSDLVEDSITITEDDCYNIYSLYYGQNFETLESVSDFCKTGTITASIEESDIYGKYIVADSSTRKAGSFYTIEDLNIPSSGSYILEFDASIGNTNSSSTSTFYILTEQSNIKSYLLRMDTTTYNNGSNNLTWIINESDTSVQISTDFFHYRLIVDRTTEQIGLSIFSLDGDVIIEKEIINKSSDATTDIANSFYMTLSKGNRGTIKLNNISVYTYENAKIIAPFTEREINISLDSDLSLTTDVNKSYYCEASFSGTEITIKSKNPGKTYMFFKGILAINDNIALVLIIVDIDERGFISYDENFYVFSTDILFDKIPSTIQKEYQTSSSIDELDVSEPQDNTNITPSVNEEEINTKISEFDYEELIKPRAKIAFCITLNKWCILYTEDTEINEYSEYALYETTYDGLLDCVNASFSFLSSERTSKEKISIITSGSTGTASQNPNSIVSSSNRMNSSISISCKSYLILDFENNYIYIDNSENYIDSSEKEYSIQCFIDIERYIHHITISNLNLMGMHTYGIFVAGSSYILFKNINISIAQGDHYSSSIGIRAQSQSNATCNVSLSRWSHDLYFDNCSFNGLGEHGIETFNAYNIYATTIKITDVGGCGVLLNCSYNAWIIRVIGIRCCASGTYAAVRFANDAGPNINIHYVYGKACGNGVFLVSSSNGITVDKINLININSTPVYIGGSGGLHIQSGKIISNGGTLTYHTYKGSNGTSTAATGGAIFLVNGSSSQFLPQWNNIFENLIIDGFNVGYTERYNMSSNYNIYNNIDTSGCQNAKSAASNGTGTSQDIGFGFCVIDGKKGSGNEVTTGETVVSGDFTLALNSDSTSYIIIEYSGSDSTITIPKEYNELPISKIGSFAFYGNDSLVSVTIDNNITSLGGLSFGDCSSLENVTFLSGGSYEIGHCAFRGCNNLANVDLTDVSILRASCFALCKNLKTLTCPKTVVYFGANCFYNDNLDLTIECDDISLMTVEPYAFYFIGLDSTINFTGISQPTTLTGVSATGSNSYYYNSHSYIEENLYKPGIWCKYYYHVAVTPTFVE